MQKLSTPQRQTLLHELRTEKNPFRFAKLMNENEVGRVAVHPTYHRYRPPQSKAAAAHISQYEKQVTSLFQTPEDFKRSLFIFETLYAEREAWDMFLQNGSRFDMSSRMAYACAGSIFDGDNMRAYGEGDRSLYTRRDEGNPVFAAAKRVMESSSGILIFGVFSDWCVASAAKGLGEMAELLKLDLPYIALNPAFSLSIKQIEEKDPAPNLALRVLSSLANPGKSPAQA